jgi:hypothetical protein
MTILHAKVTDVSIGFLTIEGLLADDGQFYVAVPQIAALFQFLNKNASRDLKALLGEGFQFLKLRTPLNPKTVNAVQLSDFETIILELAIKGNENAQKFARDLVGLSLHQLFCSAFKIKFDAADAQEFLKSRGAGIVARKSFTDSIKDFYNEHPELTYNYSAYASVSDMVNLAVFGKTAADLREERGIPEKALLRDSHSATDLQIIDKIESHAKKLMFKQGVHPTEATQQAIEFWVE